MMTRAERLRRLAALEDKLRVKPKPRAYTRITNTGAWLGAPPPPEGPRPSDLVANITYHRPVEGVHGGRPSTPEELAAARDRPDDVARGHRHYAGDGREACRP